MPDWSYMTLFRPILFRLPSRVARSFTLGAMGGLSRIPGGTLIIRTLGHMEPSPLLETRAAGISLPTPVGLSGTLDPTGFAHKAMAPFGFGFMEIGPVTVEPIRSAAPITREADSESIRYPTYYENEGLDHVAARVSAPRHQLPQFLRVTTLPDSTFGQAREQLQELIVRLTQAGAAGFYVDLTGLPHFLEELTALLCQAPAWTSAPLFLYVPLDYPEAFLWQLLEGMELSGWAGIVIGEAFLSPGGGVQVGRDGMSESLRKLRLAESLPQLPDGFTLKASAGVHEPADALELLQAGADCLLLHSGLVYAGPGLPKRVNEAILYEKLRSEPKPPEPSFWKHWGWMCLMGLGMILGGLLAWLVAATTVLLPYDVAFLGMHHHDIHRINENLLHFMSHDRITLAGTMISIGILYFQMARYGLKDGLHWVKTALLTSGLVGFSSFFLYLGYGYFDPLHAAAAALLLPLFVLGMRGNPDRPYRKPVHLYNDKIWRLALWGQLCMVVLGFALAIGGLTIAGVGITTVFVPEDLEFLGTSPAELQAANPRLVPLIAHDRAGFGGALFSCALALLILALWGIQRGERWLWWTLLLGGSPAFVAALSVHVHIGYTDWWHLLPAFVALALYIPGLVLLHPYLKAYRSD